MTLKKDEVKSAEALVEKRQDIENKIQSICDQLSRLNVASLGRACGEAIFKSKNYLEYYGKGSEVNLSVTRAAEYKHLKIDAEEKKSQYLSEKSKDEALRAELAELNTELESLGYQSSHNDVLRHQAIVFGIESQISELKRVIAQEEDKIAQSNVGSELLGHLHNKRSDLMADKAMGMVIEQSLLDEIETQICDEETRINQIKAAGSQAEIVVFGLRRKIHDVEQSLVPAKKTLEGVYFNYLVTEAEKTGLEFTALASKLWKKHVRLLALGNMIEQHPNSKGMSIVSGDCANFNIPAFNLKSCQNKEVHSRWFAHHNEQLDIGTEIEQVKCDMATLGIKA